MFRRRGSTEVTVAVSVTFWLATGEVGKELIAVVVDAMETVTSIAGDVLAPLLVSPPYTAVTESVPAGRPVVSRVATPLEIVPVPSEVVPL